jgi:hypothetical protein
MAYSRRGGRGVGLQRPSRPHARQRNVTVRHSVTGPRSRARGRDAPRAAPQPLQRRGFAGGPAGGSGGVQSGMSYDLYLMIDTGGPEPAEVADVGNYTSNVSPLWALALGKPLSEFHGAAAGSCVKTLEKAVRHMRDPANAARYRAMQPENGWGNLEGATRYLEDLLSECRRHPRAWVYVSY